MQFLGDGSVKKMIYSLCRYKEPEQNSLLMVVTLSVAVLYVATKCIDQFIKEEGYGRLKSFLFSKGKYINLLRELIMTVIDDFAKT